EFEFVIGVKILETQFCSAKGRIDIGSSQQGCGEARPVGSKLDTFDSSTAPLASATGLKTSQTQNFIHGQVSLGQVVVVTDQAKLKFVAKRIGNTPHFKTVIGSCSCVSLSKRFNFGVFLQF